MAIELFVFPISPRAFRVLAVANYLGLDYVQHTVDLISGEQRAPDYAALNPNMLMPTLKDGNYILWESHAICQYLALDGRPRHVLTATKVGGQGRRNDVSMDVDGLDCRHIACDLLRSARRPYDPVPHQTNPLTRDFHKISGLQESVWE